MSDPINFCKNEGNCRDVPCPNATSDISLIAKELFHMFKTVSEVDLPYNPFSLSNFSSPAVKNICIDQVQCFEKVTEQDEKLTTMSSPMQAEECRQNEEAVWRNKDLLENAASFLVSSADTNSNRIDRIKGASEDVKLNDGTITSDLEVKDISIVGNESEVINQQSVQTRIGRGIKELINGGTTAIQSLSGHLILEDTSLPGAAALSDPITTSGHIPYSGNISHRSDSSTTSTHSFAFPILQSEWNSSPVKMAKADRKKLRKHRWRKALICCKF